MKTGLSHTSSTVVEMGKNTAVAMGSGDMEVFATPSLAALMENAAMMTVAGELPEGSTTVGARLDISHLKPTAPGDTVHATAILTEADGRKLTFTLTAEDNRGVVGEGTHVRYIVERERFLSKL